MENRLYQKPRHGKLLVECRCVYGFRQVHPDNSLSNSIRLGHRKFPTSLNLDTGTGATSRLRDEDVADALQSVFGLSDYLDIFLEVEYDIERDTQALVFSRLLEASKSESKTESGKALFQLAIASACGLGTPYGEDSDSLRR